jgi:hypothetical protein
VESKQKKIGLVVQRQIQENLQVSLKVLPPQFFGYIQNHVEKIGIGGKKHFLATLKDQGKDATEELLNILEDAWTKDRGDSSLARKYHVSVDTIYRLRKDLKPFRDQIVQYLKTTTRIKRFYVEETDSSDYDSVQNYILRARRDGLKQYKIRIKTAKKLWTFLNYKAPENWTADDVLSFFSGKSPSSQSGYLDAVRQVAPQIKSDSGAHTIKTGRFREKIPRRKKDIFGKEVKMILDALERRKMKYQRTILQLHISEGMREGKSDSDSGMNGVRWASFKQDFSKMDIFERKVRGGINWRDCPVDIFFKELPEELKTIWKERGRPTDAKLLLGGYKELRQIYRDIREALGQEYEGKIDPSLLKEFITLRPHDADKIHVNMLWEAEVPLEIVGGQDLGGSEGIGLCGRGWLDVNVIKKYYLSMTARSPRFQKTRDQITAYSHIFNGLNS